MGAFDDLIPGGEQDSGAAGGAFDDLIPPKKQNKGIMGDLGTDLKRGAQQIPGMLTGLVDIPVAAITGQAAIGEGWDRVGKLTGIQPGKWAEEAKAEYSPARQEANRQKEAAWENGTAADIAGAYLKNPAHNILGPIVESAPSMVVGGIAARGIGLATKMAPAIAGGIGEGGIMAGQAMQNMTDQGVDPRTAAGYSAMTGGVGAIIGAGGGKLAQRLGVIDPDTAMAGGIARAASEATGMAAAKETGKRMLGGGISEGLFEELPQSVMEQGFSNLAQGKPATEGMARAGVEGSLAGFGMGAGFNALPGSKYAESKRQPTEEQPAIAGLLPAPTYTGTPSDQVLQAEAERQAAVDAALKSADQLYAERAAYDEAMQALYPVGLPTLTTDPAPLQQRIDAMLGIGPNGLKGLRKVQYQKQLEAAFKEVVGITHDENGREIPLTMGALLDSQAMAEDSAKRRIAGENAGVRSQQLADEETQQQPDIAPGYVAPVIPIVGPLSAVANMAVQSGANAAATIQQAASNVATQEKANGGIAAQANAQVATPGAQGPGGELPGSASLSPSAPAGIAGRTGNGAEVAAPILRPAVSAGTAGAQGAAVAPNIQGQAPNIAPVAPNIDQSNADAIAPAGDAYQNLAPSIGAIEQQAATGLPVATAGESRPAPAADQIAVKYEAPSAATFPAESVAPNQAPIKNAAAVDATFPPNFDPDVQYAKRADGSYKTKGEYTPDEWAAYTKSAIDKKLAATKTDAEPEPRKGIRTIDKWTAEELQARLDRGGLTEESRQKISAQLESVNRINAEKNAKATARAERVAKMRAGLEANKGTFLVGVDKDSAERVSVRNGTVYLGDYPAEDYETGNDITVPEGATQQQIFDALIGGQAVTGKSKIFGKNGPEQSAAERMAELEAERAAMSPAERNAAVAIEAAMDAVSAAAEQHGIDQSEESTLSFIGASNDEIQQSRPASDDDAGAARKAEEGATGADGSSEGQAGGSSQERDGNAQGQAGSVAKAAEQSHAVETAADTEKPKRKSSQEWVDEGKTPDQLRADKVDSISTELAGQIAEESSNNDFAPSELPAAVRAWADEAGVPDDELRQSLLKRLAGFKISDGRMVQIRRALDPTRQVAVDAKKQEETKPAEDDRVPRQYSTMDDIDSAIEGIYDGTVSITDYKAAFNGLLTNKEAITAELGKMTIPQLHDRFGKQPYGRPEKKSEIIERAFEAVRNTFSLRRSYGRNSYTMGAGMYEKYHADNLAALTELVNSSAAEDLKAYADEIGKTRAARQQKVEAAQDPKTVEDFDNALRLKKSEGMSFAEARMSLTPEQRAEYDRLKGIESRDQRKARADQQKTDVRVASQTTGAQIVEGTHSKYGYALWSVQLADRVDGDSYKTLLSTAKRMGGNYVNQMQARNWKTVWGFQFRDQASAEAFMKLAAGDKAEAESKIQERRDAFADDRSQSAVERLNEMADRLEERADESLGRERKANTERRARFAASAESAANAEKAMATTMRRIASAISDGTAQFLDRVRQKAQIEYLTATLRSAKGVELRTKYTSYGEQQKHEGEPATAESADYAEFPQYAMMRSDLANLARKMVALPNMKMLGQRILKVADDTSTVYNAFAKEHLLAVSKFGSVERGGWATFSTLKDAERSIEVSNLTAVAVPLQIKRGEYRIVLSPSEAINRGIWKGDDRKMTLAPDVGTEIVEKLGRLNRKQGNRLGMDSPPEAPWQFENAYNNRKRLAGLGIEQPWEFRAALREFAGLKEAPKEADKITAMERAMVGRKNDGLDFFPTPAATAQAMIDAAEITEGMSVLEPSAGMGHIAEQIRESGVEPDVIEFNSDRRELLEAKGFNVVGADFMEADGRYDRIIMNPPFSNRSDAEHVQHAYSLLKPGGRLVAIMGEGVFFGQDAKAKAFRDWLEEVGGTSEKLEEGTFLDPSLPVNTATNARMVVVEKPEGVSAPADNEGAGNVANADPLSKNDTAIYGMAAEGKSAAEILKHIAATSRTPFNRQLARLLQKTGISPRITVGDGKGWKMNAGNDKAYAAAYNPATDTVALFRPASAERHVLHELIHAASLKALAKKGLAAGQMKALFAHVKKSGQLTGMYGMENVDEFIAEAFSNPKFQEALKKVSAPSATSSLKSGWHWFVRIVRGILGIPQGQENALSQALEIGIGVMRENMKAATPNTQTDYAGARGSEMQERPSVRAVTGSMAEPAQSKVGAGGKTNAIAISDSVQASAIKAAQKVQDESNAFDLEEEIKSVSENGEADLSSLIANPKYWDAENEEFTSEWYKQVDLMNEQKARDNLRLLSITELSDLDGAYHKAQYAAMVSILDSIGILYKDTSSNSSKYLEVGRLKLRFANHANTTRSVMAQVSNMDEVTSLINVAPGEYKFAEALDAVMRENMRLNEAGGETLYNAAPGKINQADTAAFKKWFAGSKVVDADGRPLRMFHGTSKDADFSKFKVWSRGAWFTSSDEVASEYAEQNDSQADKYNPDTRRYEKVNYSGRIMPVYLKIENPYKLTNEDRFKVNTGNYAKAQRELFARVRAMGHDGIQWNDGLAKEWVAIGGPDQIKSATGNNGDFSPSNPDIRYNVADEGWSVSEPSKMDDVIYALQDKQIDLKRVVQSIMKTGKQIRDDFNAYLQEELFHGRAAKGVKDFLDFELRPLLAQMNAAKIDLGDFEEYLWNRHAEERNKQVAKVNPEMKDGGSGIKTADARAYLAGLSAEQRSAFEALAAKVEAMNRNSQGILVSSGLEKQSTIDAWNGAYQHYVPLQREDVDSGHIGTGQGFSVRGSASKRAMGSGRAVVDIIANLAMQRERNIVRAEKNRVSNAAMGLALDNPNAEFWTVDQAPKERVVENKAIYTVLDAAGKKVEEFTRLADAERLANKTAGATIDQTWGDRVAERVEPGFKNRDHVLLTRVNGEDHYIVFNERDERAMRMAQSLKSLDVDNLGRVLSLVGKGTRYLASVNTQYNPVFGVINLIRDVQGALLNLSSTPIAGEQKRVMGYTKDALVGIYQDIRAHRAGKKPSSAWASLFEEFQKEGGQTGYRDQYANAEARAEAIKAELGHFKDGKAKQFTRGVFGWLSDYNETMENSVRLAAYKVAKERGMSKQQAASLAKTITVNFNRKGQMATQVGALYAFFNASVQGTARIAQTLFDMKDGDIKTARLSKVGKKIVAGGIMLGSMQALLLAAAGFDDDEPPEFIRERNLILPIGDGKYLTLAMPLGFHVLPGIGRIATEFVLSGGKDPIKKLASFAGMFADTFNPVGNAGFSLQSITPSVVDPFAALAENRDFTGKEIYREDFNKLAPKPGHERAKDVATFYSRWISEALNFITGGSEFKPGLVSWSPDGIDYLIGQATGGVGREANKVAQTAGSAWTGADLPLYKIPLVGRFVGDTAGQSGQSAKFYEAIKQINMHEAEYKGLLKEGRREEARAYLAENPSVKLIMAGNHAELTLRKLRGQKRSLVEKSADQDQVQAIDQRITEVMRSFNDRAGAVI